MSMYADYIKERLGDECIETEDGFITYRFLPPSSVYIVDIYVKPEARRSDMSGALSDKVVSIAKAKGYSKLIGTVAVANKTSTLGLKAILSYGMHLVSSNAEYLVFEKEI